MHAFSFLISHSFKKWRTCHLFMLLVCFLLAPASIEARYRACPSCIYSFDLPPLNAGEIAFINGMNHRPDRAIRCALLISKRAGLCNVYTIYNPTDGLFGDLKKCYHELYRYKASAPVLKLHERWDAFFSDAKPYETYLQFCHSQGAIQVRNALMRYPKELRSRITVIAIAPAAYIDDSLCKRAFHYISRRDIVPYFDFRGRKRCKATIITLTPHLNAPFFDHHFLSPTYRDAIEYHLRDYLNLSKKHYLCTTSQTPLPP